MALDSEEVVLARELVQPPEYVFGKG